MAVTPAIFLDKDGTLIHDIPYNVDLNRITLRDGTREGLQALHQRGYKLIVITNQSGVARGYFPESAIALVEAKLRALLAPIPLAGFYYCPHHPQGAIAPYAVTCGCRKPKPGMLLNAAQRHNVDLSESWFIGDILNDVEAGNRAGCRTILIDNGNETEWDMSTPERQYTHRAQDIAQAATLISRAARHVPT